MRVAEDKANVFFNLGGDLAAITEILLNMTCFAGIINNINHEINERDGFLSRERYYYEGISIIHKLKPVVNRGFNKLTLREAPEIPTMISLVGQVLARAAILMKPHLKADHSPCSAPEGRDGITLCIVKNVKEHHKLNILDL